MVLSRRTTTATIYWKTGSTKDANGVILNDGSSETVEFSCRPEPQTGKYQPTKDGDRIPFSYKVFADIFPDGLFNEDQVFLVMGFTKGDPQKPVEPSGHVVHEPVSVEDGDDVVVIGFKGRLRDLVAVIFHGFALVSEDESGFV